MGLRKCCVPGCKDTKSTRRSFPIYEEEVYNIWLERIANPELYSLEPQIVKKKKVICNSHFSVHCQLEGSVRLKYQSLPTINVPGFHGEPNLKNSLYPYFSNRVELPSATTGQTVAPSTSCIKDTSDACTDLVVTTGAVLDPEADKQEASTSVSDQLKKQPSMITNRKNLKRKGILSAASTMRKSELNQQALGLYKVARSLLKKQVYFKKQCQNLKARVKDLQNYMETKEYDIISNLKKPAFDFIQCIVRNYGRKPNTRRFTEDEKIYALSILKASPRCYQLLRKTFALPSKTILLKMLQKVPFKAGINDRLFNALQVSVQKLNPKDRYCCLIFDEMQLSANITYSAHEDEFMGLEDFGYEKQNVLADHALVFMVRGLRKSWKQPVAYYFVYRTVSSARLYTIIKEIIRHCENIGLHMIATISDQGSTNRGAVALLKEETSRICAEMHLQNKYVGYLIDGKEIVHIYDPPHLLKCVRNTFMENNIEFTWQGKRMLAKWEDVIAFYENDGGNDDIRLNPKLTERHLFKDKMNKMKVSLAAQVFSQRLSALMRKFAGCNIPGVMVLPESTAATAEFLHFMDKVFDSVNGKAERVRDGKNLRVAISNNSPHFPFWREAIEVFSSIKIYNIKTKKHMSTPPTFRNWIQTLKGLRHLWGTLNKLGFRYLSLRNLNQDPLENLFGMIRAHGYRDVNPTCSNFSFLIKTPILNNFAGPKSYERNCEDDGTGSLDTLKVFLKETYHHDEVEISAIDIHDIPPLDDNMISQASKTYVAGYVARKLLKQINNCSICKNDLIADETSEIHCVIEARSYTAKSLCFPNTTYSFIFSNIVHIITYLLPTIANRRRISKILKQAIVKMITAQFTCNEHNLVSLITSFLITFMSRIWSKNINRILKGITCHESELKNDAMKLAAHKYYLKHKKKTFRHAGHS